MQEQIKILIRNNDTYDDDSDNGSDDENVDEDNDGDTLSHEILEKHTHSNTKDSVLRKIRFKAFLFNHKNIQIGYNYDSLLHKNIDEVFCCFHNKAFNNIKLIPIEDVYINAPYTEGEVEQIVISGSSYFEESCFIPYDTEIIITYHKKKRISIPFSSRSLRKKNYIEVGDMFQELGFTEVFERPIRDLSTGWITKDGSVEKVYIKNSDSFKRNNSFNFDVKITIEYHTFKNK